MREGVEHYQSRRDVPRLEPVALRHGVLPDLNRPRSRLNLTVWRHSGPTTVRVPLARRAGGPLAVDAVFPTSLPTSVHWDAAAGELVLELLDELAARALRIRMARTSGQAS
ncbi:hypothetical protein GCM10017576_28210 [Microbacterium barkeri]|uniref:Uncharacterized protein n=1 Tax=Microbacterium barkeri TaxID=33917 RepID=A0A9W6H5Z3_9MICO|nr:hypothetical protein GCM10017576_28210 [Microbacterium barkeri]